MSGQERDFSSPVTANFLAEMERVGLPNVVVARGIGVSERQITRWRNATTVPRYESVRRMAAYFGRSPEWFYTRDDERAAA